MNEEEGVLGFTEERGYYAGVGECWISSFVSFLPSSFYYYFVAERMDGERWGRYRCRALVRAVGVRRASQSNPGV
jgi:hypothetical protein